MSSLRSKLEQQVTNWPCLPVHVTVVEFFGDGDLFFGESADDRPLGLNGELLVGGYHREEVKEFIDIAEAINHAESASNVRAGGRISLLPCWS